MFLTLSSPADDNLFAVLTIIFAELETSTERQTVNLQILGVWFSFSYNTKIPHALIFSPAHYAQYIQGVSTTTCFNGIGKSESPTMVHTSV